VTRLIPTKIVDREVKVTAWELPDQRLLTDKMDAVVEPRLFWGSVSVPPTTLAQ
jgi:hypothetical protein